jgi:glyoxylase-like metal-dependent hydrolase (beta-lactamase superfamily II)
MIRLKIDLGGGRRLLHYRGVTGNTYLVVDVVDNHTHLVDCGMPADLPGLLEALADLPPLERVVCTHFHIDHIGGWFGLKQAFPDSTLWFREPARPWICGHKRLPPPDRRVIRDLFLPVMREYGYRPGWHDIRATRLYGTGFRPGFPLDGVHFFGAGDHLLPGFETVPTPGHRPEHTAFWNAEKQVLICGDFVLRTGDRVITNPFLSSPGDQARSLARVRHLGEIRLLCPGHGKCATWDPRRGSW